VWFVALGSRQKEGEKTIAVLGADAIRIDVDRQRQRAIELAGHTLPSMTLASFE
jgi:hypothetical protein